MQALFDLRTVCYLLLFVCCCLLLMFADVYSSLLDFCMLFVFCCVFAVVCFCCCRRIFEIMCFRCCWLRLRFSKLVDSCGDKAVASFSRWYPVLIHLGFDLYRYMSEVLSKT